MFPTSALTITTTPNWERMSQLTTVRSEVGPPVDQTAERAEAQRVSDFLELAREQFRIAALATEKMRYEMLIDHKFRWGMQWDEWVELRRKQQGRPCLTINRIPGFLKHVMNALRQARPSIKVDPVADGADEEIAEIRQGVIRYIERISQAEIAYDTGFENMCIGGLGFIRIVDAWAGKSMDKDLFIQWVPNSFSVYFDPAASKPDWSDAKYCFIVEDLSLPEFRRRFGRKKDAASAENFQSIGDHSPFWLPGGKVRVAEYFYKEEETELLFEIQHADGSIENKYSSEMPTPEPGVEPEFKVLRSRTEKVEKVKWALISALDILKEREWFGRYIPVIPVLGNQAELDGERILAGMVRFSRESQRMYNYMYTSFVEAIALAPKAPFIAEFNQIQRFRDIWERANTDPMAVLPYESVSAENGAALPAPQRQQAEPPISAFVAGLKLADENLKATFSIYDASLGQKGPQESGIAINSRKVESDQATYDWIDNFHRAQIYLGIVLDDLLPYYYNTPGRVIQVLGEDGSGRAVTFNLDHMDQGQLKKYDLKGGKFAISLATGPNSETKRRESAQGMLDLAKVYPPLMQVAGPIIIREMDFPGKEKIAAQLEKAMPPELRTQDPNSPEAQIPQIAQDKINQATQMVQQLTAVVHELSDKKSSEREKEIWDTFREQMRQETALAIADLKTGSQEAQYLNDRLFAELEHIRATLQPQTVDGGQPAAVNSPAPASAAPAAPAQPPVPQAVPVGAPQGVTPPA